MKFAVFTKTQPLIPCLQVPANRLYAESQETCLQSHIPIFLLISILLFHILFLVKACPGQCNQMPPILLVSKSLNRQIYDSFFRNQPFARPLPTQDKKTHTKLYTNPCSAQDSNPLCQCPRGRKQSMLQAEWLLQSAVIPFKSSFYCIFRPCFNQKI
jgi:hypothetical protein